MQDEPSSGPQERWIRFVGIGEWLAMRLAICCLVGFLHPQETQQEQCTPACSCASMDQKSKILPPDFSDLVGEHQ